MTREEINALRSPEQRPAGVTYDDYKRLCFTGGVTDNISKSDWEALPLQKGSYMDKAAALSSMTARPNGLPYADYKKMCKGAGCPAMGKADFEALEIDDEMDLEKFYRSMGMEMSKADDEDMGDADIENDGEETEISEADEDDDAQEDEEMDDESVEKSVNVSDLMKAIDAYEDVEAALAPDESTEGSREGYLTARLDAGTISKSERTELAQIWIGEQDGTPAKPEQIQKSLFDTVSEDEDAGHLVDASDFLRTLVKGVDTRMNGVLGEVTRDGRATRELLKAQGSLVKSMAAHAEKQDELIKAMTERLASIEEAPVTRRAVTSSRNIAPRTLQKSVYAGAADQGDNMSKSQVTEGLRSLLIHAADSNDQGAMDRITRATALFEQTGNIPANIMDAVRQVS